MSTIALLFLLAFLLTLVNLAWCLFYTIPRKKIHRQVLHFTYDRNYLCYSKPLSANIEHCMNQVNVIAYGALSWIGGPKDLIGTIYITTGSINSTLFLENYWVTFSNQDSIVVGAIRWSALYKNKIIDPKDPSRTNVPYVIASVAATSERFNNFSVGKVFFDFRNLNRNIFIFGNGYDAKLKDYI